MSDDQALLEVRDLVKHFPIRKGVFRHVGSVVRAVDGVSFELNRGETLGLVGESGCGKSSTGKLLMRLEQPTSGAIRYDGQDLSGLTGSASKAFARNIQIVFQDPYASLSPRMTVHDIVAEPLRVQRIYGRTGGAKVSAALQSVGLTEQHASRYAHEFSGGQRQRIGIARALVLDPTVLVLDEPVSALDVSIRAQVINTLEQLQDELGLAYLFISHDLSVVRHTCDRVAVMYLGKIVETGTRRQIFGAPTHPYTQALLSAIPSPDVIEEDDGGPKRERIVLRGDVPSPSNPPSGCRFRTRCWKAQDICASAEPPLLAQGTDDHLVACHFPQAIDVLAGQPIGQYSEAE